MLIRKLSAPERVLFADHLKRLNAEDRRYRFVVSAMSDWRIDAYVEAIPADDVIIGAFTDSHLIGAAHMGLFGRVAEIGLTVNCGQRRRGVGVELLRRAARVARNRLAERLQVLCLADNVAIMAMARALKMDVRQDGVTAEASLRLPPPNVATIADELAMDALGAFVGWMELFELGSMRPVPAR